MQLSYKTQIVLGSDSLASLLSIDQTLLKRTYSDSIQRFEEGKHFFKLSHEESSLANDADLFDYSGSNGLLLWTKKGASRLVSLLDDDDVLDNWEDSSPKAYRASSAITRLDLETLRIRTSTDRASVLFALIVPSIVDKLIEEFDSKEKTDEFHDTIDAIFTSIAHVLHTEHPTSRQSIRINIDGPNDYKISKKILKGDA